jgi:hypothetical protein
MNVFNNITSGTRAALLYITVGALTIVWSGLYFVYLRNHPPEPGTDLPFYLCAGFFLSGMTLLAIGLGVGWIGRSARPAEQQHAIINTQDNLGNATQGVVPVANSASQPALPVPVASPAAVAPAPPQALSAPTNVAVAHAPRT